jgi:hypothetical protein
MAAISSTVGMQAVTQAAFQQFKLQQARQNAERAEQAALSLQAKAAEARRVAENAQENARSLSVQSKQAQSIAGQAKQGVAMVESVTDMQTRLSGTVDQTSRRQADLSVPETAAPVTTSAASYPAVSTSSVQTTGTLVNTTA